MNEDAPRNVRQFSLDDSPTLKRAWNSKKRIIGVRGPAGSGKSSWAVNLAILKFARMQKPDIDGVRRTVGMVVRKTYKELERTALRTFKQWYPDGVLSTWQENKQILTIRFNDIECAITFQGMDAPDALEKLGSFEASWIWVNEARELVFDVIDKCRERINRFPQRDNLNLEKYPGTTRPALILDSNSSDDDSWWYKLAEELVLTDPATAELYDFFAQPPGLTYTVNDDGSFNITGENPLRENQRYLDHDYYMAQVPGASNVKIRIQLLNLYGANVSGAPVYTEYSETKHFNPNLLRPDPGLPIWRCWDFGRRPCCLFVQTDRKGHVNIFDELTSVDDSGKIHGQGADEFSDKVKTYCLATYPNAHWFDVGDPSGGDPGQLSDSTPFMILQSKGFNIMPGGTQSLDGADDTRLEAVRRGLRLTIDGKPIVQIGPRARLFKKGMGGYYRYEKIKKTASSGRVLLKPKPEKDEYSDPQDAFQYWATLNMTNYSQQNYTSGTRQGQSAIPAQTNQPRADGFYF